MADGTVASSVVDLSTLPLGLRNLEDPLDGVSGAVVMDHRHFVMLVIGGVAQVDEGFYPAVFAAQDGPGANEIITVKHGRQVVCMHGRVSTVLLIVFKL